MDNLQNNQKSDTTPMGYDTLLETVDYSKKENQIGCGYCVKEKDCTMREQKVNKAKQGCKEWQHWQYEKYGKFSTDLHTIEKIIMPLAGFVKPI